MWTQRHDVTALRLMRGVGSRHAICPPWGETTARQREKLTRHTLTCPKFGAILKRFARVSRLLLPAPWADCRQRGRSRRNQAPGEESRLAGRISEATVAEVKRAADIVEIISRYVELKKAGGRYKALCPFHNEKTPSFTVHPERQFFKCFGCGKGGDVFSFVAEHERVEFPEAVRIVAAAVGVSIPETAAGRPGVSTHAKTRLYELHAWAARFFAQQLLQDGSGRTAREYLASRHFDKQTLETWRIGFAPDAWDALGKAARAGGYHDKELEAAGLVVARDGGDGCYDRFRNRVVFPICDVQGRVIAFGGRTLGDSEAKYLNSPETPLFSKGRGLYGLDKARDAIVERRQVVVTEGYTDTLMCHQQGIRWAVATLGTALTGDHVRLLRRYADRVVLVFDADQAGEAAVDRSLEVFADADLDVRVATVAQGEDPCEFLVKRGPDAFVERLDSAQDLFAVKLDLVCRKHDVQTAAGRTKALDEALRSVAGVSNPAKGDLWGQAAAKRMGVDLPAARLRLSRLRKVRRKPGQDEPDEKAPDLDPLESGILTAVLAANELVPCVLAKATLDDFEDERVRRILEQSIQLYDREGEVDLGELSALLQDRELAAIVADIANDALDRGNWEPWLQDCLDRLHDRQQSAQKLRLREQATRDGGEPDRQALAAIYEQHRQRAGGAKHTAAEGG